MRMYNQPEYDLVQLDQSELEIWNEYRHTELMTRSERIISAAKWAAGIAFMFGAVVGLEAVHAISPY